MSLPTFVVIGAMKAGTTSLWAYLRSHPDVFMPEEKEPDFFVGEKGWGRGLEWYEQLFAPGAEAVAKGEASTNYSKHPLFAGVPERMASVIPHAKLVYIVRDPISRMRAHYLHALSENWERRPIDRALVEEPQYLDVSRYATQIDRFLASYDRSQLLVVTAEALLTDRAATVARVYSFIGVDPAWRPPRLDEKTHATAEKTARRPSAQAAARLPGWALAGRLTPARIRRAWRKRTTVDLDPTSWTISAEVETRLRDELRPEVGRLRSFLGSHFDGWGIA